MTNELVKVNEIDINGLKQIGQLLAESGYFTTDNVRASAAQLVVKVMAGRELGYGPWASASGIHIIKGKMSVSANLMADAVKRSGRYDYRIREMSDKKVSIEFFAVESGKRESLGTSEFTYEDGKRAGTQNLDKFPKNMLFARAMSNGVKWFSPDVFSGNAVYVAEELGATVDGDGNYVDSTATRTADAATGEITEAPVVDTDKARKRLHAIGAKQFGADWDEARHWLIARYTARHQPVRTSSSDLTGAESTDLADWIEKANGKLVDQFKAHQAEQLARRAEALIAAAPEMADGANPFTDGDE